VAYLWLTVELTRYLTQSFKIKKTGAKRSQRCQAFLLLLVICGSKCSDGNLRTIKFGLLIA
jgi:hypothetical protein